MTRAADPSALGASLAAAAVMVGFSCVLVADRRSRHRARPRPALAGMPVGPRRV
jgi:hypothetical protein